MAVTQRGSVLEAGDKAASDKFGFGVALSHDANILAVGATGWEGAVGTNRGGVYVFDINGTGWTQRGSVLEASDAADSDQFGDAVSLSADGSVLAVGAVTWENVGTNRGGVYIFDKNGTGWTQRGSVLEASDAADSDLFGYSVALSRDGLVLAVGAVNWEGATGTDRGSVYIYDKNGTGWTQRGSVLEAPDAADLDSFGRGVALNYDGSVLVVGANNWEGAAGSNRGGVYVFDKNGTGWTQRGSVIEASDAADNDNFGTNVAIDSNGFTIAVGAFNWEGAAGTDRGGVYLYHKNGTGWTQSGSVLEASDAADTDNFGTSVALGNGGIVLAVGAALWESGATSDTGGVYVYDIDTTALAGAAAGAAAASGSLTTGIALAGSSAGAASSTGDLTTAIQLAVAAAAVVTASAALENSSINLSGAPAGVAGASGDLSTEILLDANAISQALATGAMSTQINMAGIAQAVASLLGNLTIAVRFNGAAVSQALASGALDTEILLAAAAHAATSSAGDLSTYRPLFADASAIAAASGALTLPVPPAKTFILGGLSLPFESHLDLNQDFEEEQSSRITRHADGSARKQTAWRGKLRTTITGQGWIPPGLDMLDYESSMEMSCIALRAVTSLDRVITIPAARRVDRGFEPFAAATLDGGKVDATITGIVGNVVTIAAVPNAQFYTVFYYPKIQVFASLPTQRHDAINDKYSWDMEAREV